MRALPTLFILSLLAASAHAQASWVESPATLTLALSCSGAYLTKPGKAGTTIYEQSIQRVRLGNREILEALKGRGLIDQIQGWRVVGIWAYWPEPADPYVGNAYRFYARRGKGASREQVAIPSSLLAIAPLNVAVGYRHVRAADETILSGTETFSVCEQVTFAIDGHAGLLQGIENGSGRYVPVAGAAAAGRYLPNASKATLQGEYSDGEDGPSGVVSGTLAFGAAKLVAENYVVPSGTSTGVTSSGVLAISTGSQTSTGSSAAGSLTKTGTGTLTLTGNNTYTGSAIVNSGTLTFGGSGTFAGITLGTDVTLAGSSPLDLSFGDFPTVAGGQLYQFFDFGSSMGDFTAVSILGSVTGSAGSFQSANNAWSVSSGSFTYLFNEADGTLTVTPVPSPAP